MKIFHHKEDLREFLQTVRGKSAPVGFVPTMGALHRGHISLVEQSVRENESTVVSIFVNPAQFDDPGDFSRYPRMLEADVALLDTTGCTCVFAPSEDGMYLVPDTRQFRFGALEAVMEGVHRPGHFNGVARIVSKLFEIVQPARAYFGEKDFQQLAIVRALVAQESLSVEITGCPIVREPDGLAMSSRNALLSPACRKSAPLIADTLMKSITLSHVLTPEALVEWVKMRIDADPLLRTEYFSLVNRSDLRSIAGWDEPQGVQGCIAVHAGDVRLIDNITYR